MDELGYEKPRPDILPGKFSVCKPEFDPDVRRVIDWSKLGIKLNCCLNYACGSICLIRIHLESDFSPTL